MSDPILIGTRGWQDAGWTGEFYPEHLPEDWRFCFYGNRLRSVLVPGEGWRDLGPATVAQWADDSDPAFRFVLELPPDWQSLAPGSLAADFDRFRDLTTPIHARTAGLLARLTAAPAPEWLEALLAAAESRWPVAVDLPARQRTAALRAICDGRSTGWCWRCAEEAVPEPAGCLLVALGPPPPPREQRRILEQLNAARRADGVAALFFDGPQAAKAAEEARILAELMAV